MLKRINLALRRGNNVYVRLRNFGVVSTHGNRKNAVQKFSTKYNKKAWAKKREAMALTEKKLLF